MVSELAPYLAAETSRPETRDALAAIKWKMDKQKEDPNYFHVPFVQDEASYNKYRNSDQWRNIRRTVFKLWHNECAACARESTQVHHRDYRLMVLDGDDLNALVPLCERCHKKVEAVRKGEHWEAGDRLLMEMVERKNQEL
ncbi:MAG: hypothetical protein P4L81_07780 [Candidatus Pacebacteria bacterium]|nr:hypothetical protein [Candidatus Paceibacterota bacterium]